MLGAVLHLASINRLEPKLWHAMALTGEEFSIELHAKAWKIARRKAEHSKPVSVDTVYAAGLGAKWFWGPEQAELQALADANVLTVEQLRAVAQELRLLAYGAHIRNRLMKLAQDIDSEAFDPARVAGALSGLERELRGSAEGFEDLTGDLMELMAGWDHHEKHQTSSVLATGIKVWDEVTGGVPRSLCVLAADAGVGKTAIQDSAILAMLQHHPGMKMGMISPEDGVKHIIKRLIARETGMLLRDVGSKQRTPEQAAQVDAINEKYFELWRRIRGYRHSEITADNLVALFWQAIEQGCGAVWCDNLNKVKFPAGPEYVSHVQRLSDRLQVAADKAGVPFIMLVHLSDTEVNKTGKGITASGGLQGGKSFGRDARFRMDLFRKEKELRGRIVKANELAEQGTVIEFSRQATAGLIDPDTGDVVDEKAERAIEKREREAQREADAQKRREARAAQKAQVKAAAAEAKKAEEEAKQQTLIEVEKQQAVERPSGWGMRWVDGQPKEDES